MQMRSVPNTLAEEAEVNRWNIVRRSWIPATSDSVPDFPRMTEEELKIFFTGTYQLSQSISYLAELINDDNTINLRIHRDNSTILKMEVQSRHIKRRTYRCYVDYAPNSTGLNASRRHYCECANGRRTVDCSSHVAALVYYLSRAHHHTRIIRPAEILNSLFHDGAAVPVIDEISDED